MRMRKKPWAKDMILSRDDCVIAEPEKLKGSWKQLGYDHVIVEIGAGKGDYWINMGHMYPDELWIAVEKNIDAAGIALKKSIDRTAANMKFIVGDAANISQWFAQGEVERIHLNFSDPWPKKHHTKRRLTYGSFLDDYAGILMPGGRIVMKTDNARLFEFSLVSFAQGSWKLVEAYVNYRENTHDEDAITEYESNFIALNQPIYRAVWEVVK
ncbi:MAG: tRNA (guanosine(46)-N7)-methyltransferase TrmB [Erysipelotrichaceae bacterium]|nr:tRNA (guanosine(46)-N7)-methyltransferase TrmB [Erysipelotrichaceae bacterium]MBO4538457.1 tRNA (guanosine(46)-N7)-methyltransferase TrmB [Erysipelotrichaceae bacterium]